MSLVPHQCSVVGEMKSVARDMSRALTIVVLGIGDLQTALQFVDSLLKDIFNTVPVTNPVITQPQEPAIMAGSLLASRSASLQQSSASILAASFRALSITPRTTQAARPSPPQARNLSHTSFSNLSTRRSALRPAVNAVAQTTSTGTGAVQAIGTRSVRAFQQQQTRGMKVQSSVKKRCEHCKVRSRKFSA